MLRLTNLANVNRRRTLRALYAQTQGYPYAVALDPSFDRSQTDPFDDADHAGKAAIWPGMVALKTVGETVRPQNANQYMDDNSTNEGARRAFGLFANFVGGELNEIGTDGTRPGGSEVGVWRGVGSVYEVLAPVFIDTGLAAEAADEDGTASNEIYMTGDEDSGRLYWDNDARPGMDWHNSTARLVKRLSDKAIIIELLV
jgi:hypothetical protein